MSLPQWLGQNSKGHQLSDIQARMRLKVSGDEVEIRQSYVPVLFLHLVKPLVADGSVSPVLGGLCILLYKGSCRMLRTT
ncbi:hypothetical protein EDD16DRAFT_1638099 [Pisolithus croceorrhizus]|nr:hypothetical protein EDD16DRAFT_1638099 [Pisolithus croceorrhizus]